MKPKIFISTLIVLALVAACSSEPASPDLFNDENETQPDVPQEPTHTVAQELETWEFSTVYELKIIDPASEVIVEYTGIIYMEPNGMVRSSIGRGGTAKGYIGAVDSVEDCETTTPVDMLFDYEPGAALVQNAPASELNVEIAYAGFTYEVQEVPQFQACLELSDEFRVGMVTHIIESMIPALDIEYRTIPLLDKSTECTSIAAGEGVSLEYCFSIQKVDG